MGSIVDVPGSSGGSGSTSSIPLVVTGNTTTRPANTTAYAFGQLIANSVTAGSVVPATTGNIARAANQAATILRCRLLKSGSSINLAIFRLHLYNTLPAVSNGDGGAWLSSQAGYQGSFDITVDKAFSDPMSEGIGIPTTGSGNNFVPISGQQNLYYLLEARAAYTPISAEVFTPIFEVL